MGEASTSQGGEAVSVAGDGNVVAIGTPAVHGTARAFLYVARNWTQVGHTIEGETACDRSGTSVSLSHDGTILAVGAPLNGGNGSGSGHVRVYRYANRTWVQIGGDVDGEASSDFSESTVDLSYDGDVLVVGA